MSKTIISNKITGENTINVLFQEVAFWGTKKGLDPEIIQKNIMECDNFIDINKILKENFEGEIKIKE